MIIALVTAMMLLTGGEAGFLGDISVYEKRMKAEIADSDRRDAALETIDRLRNRDKDYRKSLSGFLEKIGQTDADDVITEQQLEERLKPFLGDIRIYHRGIIDGRFELREQITRDEWAAIFAD